LLYGLDRAKLPIRQAGEAILVEGQMDLLLCHQSGLTNVVAVSGTALTERHLESLKRLADKVVMAFDADAAGLAASRRAVEIALSLGLETVIAALPEGTDPADLGRTDPERLKQLLTTGTEHAVDFYLKTVVAAEADPRTRAHAIKREIYPLLCHLPERIDQAHFIKKVAETTGLSEEIIWQDLKDTTPTSATSQSPTPVRPMPAPVATSRSERIFEHLVALWWWQEEKDGQPPAARATYLDLENIIGTVFIKSGLDRLQNKRGEMLLEVELGYGTEPAVLERVEVELAASLGTEHLKQELKQATLALKEAELKGDAGLIDKYIKKCQDISNLINTHS
jgi:DNA primase